MNNALFSNMSALAVPLSASSATESTTVAPFRLGYRPWLDGLRGIAILLVLASHTEPMLVPRGWLGVDLFFTLSGFLITSLLLEEWRSTGDMSFRSFYARRALRLFPALAVMLGASALVMYLFPGVGQYYRSILYSALYVSNWVIAFDLDKVSSALYLTWSLALEEQFYLLWPVMLYGALRARLRPSTMLCTLAGLIIIVAVHRSILVAQGAPILRITLASDTRADSLLIGCFAATLAHYGLTPSAWLLRVAVGTLALPFGLYLFGYGHPEAIGLSLVAVFFAALLLWLIARPSHPLLKAFSARSLVWIGKLSYSLYLWHLYANFAVEISGIDRRFWMIASIPLAFALAAASYYLIERPFLKLKQRYAVVS